MSTAYLLGNKSERDMVRGLLQWTPHSRSLGGTGCRSLSLGWADIVLWDMARPQESPGDSSDPEMMQLVSLFIKL